MSYDCICTDPPWHCCTGRGADGRPGVQFPTLTTDEIIETLSELSTQLPRYGFMVIIAPDTYRVPLERDFPPLIRKRPGIWWKVNHGMGYGFRRSYEDLHLHVGVDWKPRTSLPGVIPAPKGHNRYSTSKPTLLWHYVLEAFAHPGWVVYDPFAGGGSVRDAATILEMESVLEDLDQSEFKIKHPQTTLEIDSDNMQESESD